MASNIELQCRRCGSAGIILAMNDALAMVHYSQTLTGDESADGTDACNGPCEVAGYWSPDGSESDPVFQQQLTRQTQGGLIESALAHGWHPPVVTVDHVRRVVDCYCDPDGLGMIIPGTNDWMPDGWLCECVSAWAPMAEAWLVARGIVAEWAVRP